MDVFDSELDRATKDEDSNDDVQLTMEDGEDGGQSSVTGVVTSLTLDANGQYQFRSNSGQGSVTYRVVQVTQGENGQPQLVPSLSSNQALLPTSLANGDGSSNNLLHSGEARLTYIPSVASGGGDSVHNSQLDVATNAVNIGSTAGPFYVMMASPDVIQAASSSCNQRTLFPRAAGMVKVEPSSRVTRDDRRRATHNEVERRRRDKINSWIQQLAQLVPECTAEDRQQEVRALLSGSSIEISRHSGEDNQKSKGGILQKACDYIRELQQTNSLMAERVKVADEMLVELESLRQQCEELRQENEVLRDLLQQHGVDPPTLPSNEDPDGL